MCEPCRQAKSVSVVHVEGWEHVCGPCRWAGSVCGHVDKLAYCRVQNWQLRCEDVASGQEGPPLTQGLILAQTIGTCCVVQQDHMCSHMHICVYMHCTCVDVIQCTVNI